MRKNAFDHIYIVCGSHARGMSVCVCSVQARMPWANVTVTEPRLSKALRHPDWTIFLVLNPNDAHSSAPATGKRPPAQQGMLHSPV